MEAQTKYTIKFIETESESKEKWEKRRTSRKWCNVIIDLIAWSKGRKSHLIFFVIFFFCSHLIIGYKNANEAFSKEIQLLEMMLYFTLEFIIYY